ARLSSGTSGRRDTNSRSGGTATFRVAPAYLIPETGSKLKGSVGTGFKAPTLDQLYDSFPAFGFFANPNLKPETSLGYDFGFEQRLGDVGAGATWFHNDIKNLIAPNASFSTDINVGKAKTQGVEAFLAWNRNDVLSLRPDY